MPEVRYIQRIQFMQMMFNIMKLNDYVLWKIKLENDKIRIANENENLNSEHAIPVFLSNIIENLEVPDMHNTIELCNVHYIEVEDFEKDSDTPKSLMNIWQVC